jgi:hypothetical protein
VPPARARTRWLLYAPVVALYLLAFPYHPGLRSPNELCRLWQTRALVEHGTLEINGALRDYGYVGDLSVKDGRYYPSKAPLLSFAGVPLYKGLSVVGGGGRHAVPELPLLYWHRLLLTVLPTLLMLVLVRRFLGAYLAPALADGLTLTYALGTLAFSYSLLFISHQPTAVLVFGAFYVLWRTLRGGEGPGPAARPLDRRAALGFVGAGALCGATVAAEYTGALPVVCVALFGAVVVLGDGTAPPSARARRLAQALGLAALGALPFVAGLMAYHQAAFGHPLHSGYKYLNDPGYQDWHVGGFLGIRYPDPRAFALSFFSPLRGLFALSPFLLLALPGVLALRRAGRGLLPLTVALLVGYAYFTSSFAYESWGWTTGPRHLTPLVPFLLLPAGLALAFLHARGHRLLAGVAAGLGAGSVLVTGLSSLVNYVPDSTSNPLFALALPLFREGYLPPSLPGLLTGAHRAFGLLLIALVLVGAGVVFLRLLPPSTNRKGPSLAASAAGAVCCAAFLALLALATRHDAKDEGARRHLRSVWLTAPGREVSFWPGAPAGR